MNDPGSAPFYKFEHFFELSPDLLCIAGFDGYFKRINPAVSKLLEYSHEELISRPILDFVHEKDKIATYHSRESLSKNTPLLNFENRYITKSGEIVWLSWTSMPEENEKLIYAVAKNITARKKIEEQRNRHLANLTRIHKDLKQLTYTTSHDLRSPVSNLLSIFSLMDLSRIKDEETLEYVQILKQATENLSNILNNSVDAMTRKNKLQVELNEISLKDCLDSVLILINSIIQSSHAVIKCDFTAFDRILFHKTYLESIFLNLITNSIKYSRPRIAPEISIRSEINNGIRQLIFSDNGLGMDMDKVQNKVFRLNQRFHEHIDSKGIGLYLVYNHILEMNGNIEIKSRIDEGTTFIISLSE